jgi:uncharacterized protein (DUF1697 family)
VTVWVGLLRAVNVGGHRKVPMVDLRRVVAELPATEVRTYVQSGNVVFDSTHRREAGVVAALEAALAAGFGFPVDVVARSAIDLASVLTANPLLADDRDPARLHVTFLPRPPAPGAVLPGVQRVGADEYVLVGRELYLYTPDGIGRSKLVTMLSDRRLGVAGTVRNWRTVTTLASMASI